MTRVDEAEAVSGLNILAIDDTPLLPELFKEMLESDGNKVSVADGGASGIALFNAAAAEGKPFDVVLTDLGMPYVDGRQVAASIKSQSPATPVILLTGWGGQLDSEESKPEGIAMVLGKPPKLNDLRKALAAVTRKVA